MYHKKIIYFIYYWLPPLIWLGCIFYMSSQTSIQISTQFITNFIFFKFLHCVEYGFLFFLFYRAFFSVFSKNVFIPFFSALGISVLYSVSDEFHQLFIATRQGRIRDIGIDLLGMLVMYTIIRNVPFVKKLL